jgi:hypothetical protein
MNRTQRFTLSLWTTSGVTLDLEVKESGAAIAQIAQSHWHETFPR